MEDTGHGASLTEEAERAFAEEDHERAAALFNEAAAADPADGNAAFFGAASDALCDGAEYRRIERVAQTAEPAIRGAAERLGSGEAYFAYCRRLLAVAIDVTSRHYEAVAAYCKKERKKHRRAADEFTAADGLLRDCALTIGDAAKKTAGAVLEHAEDLSAADEFFWDCVMTLLDNADAFRVAAELGRDPEIAELFGVIDGLRGNISGEYSGVEELPEDEGEYTEIVCPACGETLSFSPAELSGGRTAECPFCGAAVSTE